MLLFRCTVGWDDKCLIVANYTEATGQPAGQALVDSNWQLRVSLSRQGGRVGEGQAIVGPTLCVCSVGIGMPSVNLIMRTIQIAAHKRNVYVRRNWLNAATNCCKLRSLPSKIITARIKKKTEKNKKQKQLTKSC